MSFDLALKREGMITLRALQVLTFVFIFVPCQGHRVIEGSLAGGAVQNIVVCLVVCRKLMYTIQDNTAFFASVFPWSHLPFKGMMCDIDCSLLW